MWGSYPTIIMRCILSLLWVRSALSIFTPRNRFADSSGSAAGHSDISRGQSNVVRTALFVLLAILPSPIGVLDTLFYRLLTYFPLPRSVLLGSMFPSFLRIKNTLPEGLGITSMFGLPSSDDVSLTLPPFQLKPSSASSSTGASKRPSPAFPYTE
jgi:hypothetical protein